MPVQQTSRDAHKRAKLSLRQQQLVDSFNDHGPQTDLEMHATTNLPINVVTGARNALVALGMVRNSGMKRQSKYGFANIVWELVPEAERQQPAAADPKPAPQLKLL
jgi:hypothetical protein